MAIKIALAGNPNCGKTTLFNALTGSSQYVGNWPGVTVEKKEGKYKGNKEVFIEDLPGIYSLSPYTLEEVVSRNYLITNRPDAIINIVDGTNLERNLYLTTQVLELGIPVIVAVNMLDILEKKGDKVNLKALSEVLGCEVVAISALKGTGVKELIDKATAIAKEKKITEIVHSFSEAAENIIASVESKLPADITEGRRFFAIKLLERDDKIHELQSGLPDVSSEISQMEKVFDDDTESIITNERYEYISSIISKCIKKVSNSKDSVSDKIDKVVTNRILALPIFAAIMTLVYYVSVTTIGTIVTDWTNDVFVGEWIIGNVSKLLEKAGTSAVLTGLICDGVLSGLGAVIGFVPQMLVLFIFLAILEECGYMARVAFIMDRIFRKFGLSGKSFIPMLIGSGCGVPGVMASRTIENDRDRKMTVMTTTFVPCGAKLPIIALIAGAFFDNGWWVSVACYFIGIFAIITSGIILKKTKMFAGDPAPFVIELPAYHAPTFGAVIRSMWERGWSFIKKAGTVITLSTIVIWFLMNFGWNGGKFGLLDFEGLEGDALVALQEKSVLAHIGSVVAPIFAPLGFGNWKFSVAAVSGLIAKENVVGTFGVLYGVAEASEAGDEFWALIAADITAVAGFAYLVFNLLCAPCFAAIGAIKREMNSVKWTWFAIGYQTILAYGVSLCIYQIGTFITTGAFGIGTVVALLLVILFIYLLVRPYKESTTLTTKVRIAKDRA